MLPDIHTTLQRLIHEHGRIDRAEVDVRFETPTKEWAERLTRPTVSCFLHDVRENTALRQATFQMTRANGRAERRMAPRRVDLRYLISALASEPEDEHRLLWRVLATLLRHPELPPDLLPAGLSMLETPVVAHLAEPEEKPGPLDLWNALSIPPRPALAYVVTVPLDLDFVLDTPLVLTSTLRFDRGLGETFTRIAGIVRDRAGTPLVGVTVAREGTAVESHTDQEGHFALSNLPHGPITLVVARPGAPPQAFPKVVPAPNYDIVLD